MKTTFHILLILILNSSIQAADANEEVRREKIARLEAELKTLRSQTQTESGEASATALVDVTNKEQQLIQLEQKLADTEKKLRKVSSVGIALPGTAPAPMPFNFNFGSWGRRLLIIPGPDTDLDQVQEDVTIMARILANQLHEQGLASWSWPNAYSIETVAIDGYGVMFIFQVDFPLLDQDDHQTEVQAESGDSVWESTKKKLHTPDVIGTVQPEPARPQPYDPDKVERLKEVLCSSLRHASNIRSLQGQQWVVVAVNAEQGDVTMNMYGGRGMMRNFSMTNVSGGQKSTMVIKAQKADIDRFADQQIGLKDFQKRVQINTFARP